MPRKSEIFQEALDTKGVEFLRKEREELGYESFLSRYKVSLVTVANHLGPKRRKNSKGPQEIIIPQLKFSEGDTLKGCAHRDLIGKVFPATPKL